MMTPGLMSLLIHALRRRMNLPALLRHPGGALNQNVNLNPAYPLI